MVWDFPKHEISSMLELNLAQSFEEIVSVFKKGLVMMVFAIHLDGYAVEILAECKFVSF